MYVYICIYIYIYTHTHTHTHTEMLIIYFLKDWICDKLHMWVLHMWQTDVERRDIFHWLQYLTWGYKSHIYNKKRKKKLLFLRYSSDIYHTPTLHLSRHFCKATAAYSHNTHTRTHNKTTMCGITFCFSTLQMAQALNSSTGNSLVLIDEFGKGTNTVRRTCSSALWIKYICIHITRTHSVTNVKRLKPIPANILQFWAAGQTDLQFSPTCATY